MKPRIVARLEDLPDVLTIPQLCAVLDISESQYYALKQHGVFPIEPLTGLGGAVRFSKSVVQQYLRCGNVTKLRRSA